MVLSHSEFFIFFDIGVKNLAGMLPMLYGHEEI